MRALPPWGPVFTPTRASRATLSTVPAGTPASLKTSSRVLLHQRGRPVRTVLAACHVGEAEASGKRPKAPSAVRRRFEREQSEKVYSGPIRWSRPRTEALRHRRLSFGARVGTGQGGGDEGRRPCHQGRVEPELVGLCHGRHRRGARRGAVSRPAASRPWVGNRHRRRLRAGRPDQLDLVQVAGIGLGGLPAPPGRRPDRFAPHIVHQYGQWVAGDHYLQRSQRRAVGRMSSPGTRPAGIRPPGTRPAKRTPARTAIDVTLNSAAARRQNGRSARLGLARAFRP